MLRGKIKQLDNDINKVLFVIIKTNLRSDIL